MSRSGLVLAALVAALLASGTLSGCGATPAPHAGPATSPKPAPASTTPRTFASPSGNITCVLSRRSAACAVSTSSWSLSPGEEHACGHSALQGAQLEAGRAAQVLCGTGVLVPAPQSTLAYGHSVAVGDFRCRSATSGVTCRDGQHSFEVSRTVLRLS